MDDNNNDKDSASSSDSFYDAEDEEDVVVDNNNDNNNDNINDDEDKDNDKDKHADNSNNIVDNQKTGHRHPSASGSAKTLIAEIESGRDIEEEVNRQVQVSQAFADDEDLLRCTTVKNLDTGETTTLFDAERSLNPIYQMLERRRPHDFPPSHSHVSSSNNNNNNTNKNNNNTPSSADNNVTNQENQTSRGRSRSRHRGRSLFKLFRGDHTTSSKDEGEKDRTGNEESNVGHIPVRAERKTRQQFGGLYRVQELRWHQGAIWKMKFSPDGEYLATGGQDGYAAIWQVSGSSARGLDAPRGTPYQFLEPTPVQVFRLDTDVTDLSWSKSNFLLTSTLDELVKVWHVSREECLATFRHPDVIAAVAFHPVNESLCVTACFDERIRLFDIPKRDMVNWTETKTLLTAVGFNETGSVTIAGSYDGRCQFYHTDGLEFITQMEVRSRRGKNKNKKVTGIQLSPSHDQVLISTNDSRIRQYFLQDYSLHIKYRGLENQQSQIQGTFSDDGQFMISGSDNCSVFIWNTDNRFTASKHMFGSERKDVIESYETFKDSESAVLHAMFAPLSKTDAIHVSDADDATGMVIATADFKGVIRIYENTLPPSKTTT